MSQTLKQTQTQNQTTTPEVSAAPIGIKLDGSNYALWSQVLEMYISGKDKLGYINGDITQPPTTEPTWRKWRTENSVVKGWLINSMEPGLIGNFIRFPTAKELWDVIATTFFDGTDTSQVYDLKKRVTKMRQNGGSIEAYYNSLQALWREIDFRRPNPMMCAIDIQKFNSITQEDRVYTFLDGLDDRLDKVRSDVLVMNPFPSVEQAYAYVRREDSRQAVMMVGGDGAMMTGGALATRGDHRSTAFQTGRSTASLPSLSLIPTGQNTGGVVSDHSSSSTRFNVRSEGGQNGSEQSNKGRSSNKPTPRVHTDGLACSHCGKSSLW